MECTMRKGGTVKNRQNGANGNKFQWIILNPWTVKYSYISERQAKFYNSTILRYRQAVQNPHNLPSFNVKTHFISMYWGEYYILYSMYQKKRALFNNKLALNFRKNLVKCYIRSTALNGVETWMICAVDCKQLESYNTWCWRRMESSCEKWSVT
jgi:hypothetical protein